MHVRRLLWLALAAVGGCGGAKPGAVVTCAPPECAADTSLALVAEVEPPLDAPFVRQEFPAIDLDPQSGQFVLTLDPQVTLRGVVRLGTGATAEPVAATVVATRPSRIPGRPDVYYQSTVDPTTGAYELVVSRNLGSKDEAYTLRVTASDPTLVPPMQKTVRALEDQTLDLVFADPLTLPEVHGAVVDSLQNPVPGMKVKAVDPETGHVVSTTVVSDAKGAFSLRLVANPPETITVEAAPTPDAPGALPSLELDVSTRLGAANALTANLRVPPLPAPSHMVYRVSGTGPSGADMPVAGAACVFSADVSDPNATDGTLATYSATGVTDDTGNVAVDLIPADSGNRAYDVVVTPDPASPFGARTTEVDVAQGGFAGALPLTLRPQVSGSVHGPDGAPVRGLMVVPSQATVAGSGALPYAASAAAPPQTVAGADGSFALRLDAGVWDIGLIPPAESMLPRLWLTGTDVARDTDFGDVVLPRGVLVRGVIHDPSGNAIARATVRLYTVAAGNAACANDAACLAPPRLRAEGSSGTDGAVGLILATEPR